MKVFRIILPVTDIEKAAQFYSYVFDQAGQRVSQGRHYFNVETVIVACYDPIADGDEIHSPWILHENHNVYFATNDLNSI